MKRRDFLKTTCAGAGAYAFGSRFLPAEVATAPVRKLASDIITLGTSGIKASRLAMGTGTHGGNGSSNQTRLGLDGVAGSLNRASTKGSISGTRPINTWLLTRTWKEALKGTPRDKVVILTKTHASTADEMKKDLDRFRQELGTDYIDILLLHCMTAAN